MNRAIFRFIRTRIIFTCFLMYLLGSLSAGGLSFWLIVAMLAIVSWYIHAASSNDFADRNIDAVNLRGSKDRPLVTNSISHSQLWSAHIISGVLALTISLLFGAKAAILMLLVLLLDYAYSFRPFSISRRGALAQIILPVAYVLLPFCLGFWSIRNNEPFPYWLVAGLYLGFVARLFLKDFRDIMGDKKFGKMTFIIRHGRKITCFVSAAVSLVSFVILCFVVGFSTGTVMVLSIGQLWALILLKRLSSKLGQTAEQEVIRTLAKIGNGSVVTILIFLASQKLSVDNSYLTILLPAAIGLAWLLFAAKSAGMVFKLNSASLLQHFAWLPLRIFGYVFCSLKIRGVENVRSIKSNVIFASNHSSELDPLMIVAALPYFSHLLPISYVARGKDFYANLPTGFLYGGKFFDLMGAYPAYTGLNNYSKSLPHHLEAIRNGWSVGIFPVGGKHRLNETERARGGVIFMAHKTGLPIVPIRIDGLEKRTIKDYILRRCKMIITFGEPIPVDQLLGKHIDRRKTLNHKTCEIAAVKLMKTIAGL